MASYTLRGLRRRRARIAAGAVIMSASLLSTYVAALREFPTYASAAGLPATRAALPRTAGCAAGATEVATEPLLQSAIASARDDSVICITESMELSSPLVLDDTSVTLVGRDDSEVVLTAPAGNRHLEATFDDSTIDDTLIVQSLTFTGGYSPADGGSVYVRGYSGDSIDFQYLTFSGNSSGGRGGALAVTLERGASPGHPVTVSQSEWSLNYADDSGGAAFFDIDLPTAGTFLDQPSLTVTFSTFSDDSTPGAGGAIYVVGDDTTSAQVIASSLSGNEAGVGGAVSVYSSSGAASLVVAGIYAARSSLTYNIAGSGGAVDVRSANGAALGVILGSVEMSSNEALTGNGGAISVTGPFASYGAQFGPFPTPLVMTLRGFYNVVLGEPTFTDDTAAGRGGAIYTNGLVLDGLPEFVYFYSIELSGSVFEGNSASNGGAIAAPFVYGFDSSFVDNTALHAGGAVYLFDDSATFLGRRLLFDGNRALGEGGGALASEGVYNSLTLADSTATNNSAGGVGGVIAAPRQSVYLANLTLDSNTADDTGGAVYAERGFASFITATGNSSGIVGGALHADDSLTVANSVFWDNSAPDDSDVSAASPWSLLHSSLTSSDSFSAADDTQALVYGDPLLGPLQDNGGFAGYALTLLTRMPAWTSSVIDAGSDDTLGLIFDERGSGFPRRSGSSTDMGAVERQVPNVQTADPSSGPPSGGTTVDIYGSGFIGIDDVVFGSQSATSFTVIDDTHVQAVTPSSSPGLVDVIVESGPHSSTLFDGFRFGSRPPVPPIPAPPSPARPSSPTDVTAIAGDSEADVAWRAPASQGASPIIGYLVTATPGGATCTSVALTCKVAGLTNGTTYTFTVEAGNSEGYGPPSLPSNAVTPMAPKPPEKSIMITGSRDPSARRPTVMVEGATTGLAGETVIPHVRFPGMAGYVTGASRPVVSESGEFRWSRKTGKKTYIYFTAGTVTSNRVIVPKANDARATPTTPRGALPSINERSRPPVTVREWSLGEQIREWYQRFSGRD